MTYRHPLQIAFLGSHNQRDLKRLTTSVNEAVGRDPLGVGIHLLGGRDVMVRVLRYDFRSPDDRQVALNRFRQSEFARRHAVRIDLAAYDPQFRAEEIVRDLTESFQPRIVT